MRIIGITGGFAAGKTTVANFFFELGAKVIDADKIAHNIIRRNSPAFREIVLNFGKGILSKDKLIDRRKLADKVFNDKRALKLLCEITHPFIISRIKKKLCEIEKVEPSSIVAIDAPLLIEAGLNKIVDWLLVVDTTAFNQLKRSMAKRGLNEDEVRRRIKMQLPLAVKKKLADYVIDNNGSLVRTKKQVEKIWEEIKNQRPI
jgi:dephospho-CoA kinase